MTAQRSEQRRKLEEKGERQTRLENDPALGEAAADEPGQPGRAGGDLARKVGTRQQEKNAYERPASRSRVRKSEEREDG